MDKKCTIYKTVDMISKKWSLLILLELYKGKSKWKRYTHLKKSLVNISPKILSYRLKELERDKILNKKIDTSEFPVKCEYSLTESGEDIIKIIKDIKKWSLKWKVKNIVCQNSNCKECNL